MTRRNLLLLGGAAAAVLGGAFLLAPRPAETPGVAGPGGGGLAFPGLAGRLAGAQRIEVRKPDATLTLEREGERWVLPEKSGYPARQEKLRELLVGLTELRLAEPRTADPAQLERLGLDDPAKPGSTALLLRVLDGAGAPIAELILGRRRVRTQGNLPESIYVRRPDATQSWLAEGRLAADADPQLWLDRDIANLPADRVLRLEAKRADAAAPLVLGRSEGGGTAPLAILEPGGQPPGDEVALDEVARAFEHLTLLDVRRAAEIPGAALGEARFGLTEGLGIAVVPHRDGEALWIRLTASGGTPETARLNAGWEGWAYQVGPWKEKAFLPTLEQLHPSEAASGEAPPAEAAPPSAFPPR